MQCKNYRQAESILKGRDKKKVANNTWLVRLGHDRIGLKLHTTFVVIYYLRYCTLHTGGWKTVTTKARINDFSSANVWQKKGDWYLSHVTEDEQYDEDFEEGMKIRNSPSRMEVLKSMIASA